LHPNPAENAISIKNSSPLEIKSVKIYDVLGRPVLTKEANFNAIDISTLAAGILFVHILNKEGVLIQQLVKE